MSRQERSASRRAVLLDQLEAAEKEWGGRLQTAIEKEAAFLRKVLDHRLGAGAAVSRIQDKLSDLVVAKIDQFLTGSGP